MEWVTPGLYAIRCDGIPAYVWVPDVDSRTALVAPLAPHAACKRVVLTPGFLDFATYIVEFPKPELMPLHPGNSLQTISNLLSDFFVWAPSPFELTYIARESFKYRLLREGMWWYSDSKVNNSKGLSRDLRLDVPSIISAPHIVSELKCAIDEALVHALDCPIKEKTYVFTTAKLKFSDDFVAEVTISLDAERSTNDWYEFNGEAGFTSIDGCNRVFNDGVEVTWCEDSKRNSAEVEQAREELLTFAITAACMALCPNLTKEDLLYASGAAIYTITRNRVADLDYWNML